MDLFTYSAGDTQREALAAIKPHLGRMQKRVLDFIKENRGATDEEIRTALGMNCGSQCARRNELQKQGLVTDSGQRRTSPSSGRNAVVWQAT